MKYKAPIRLLILLSFTSCAYLNSRAAEAVGKADKAGAAEPANATNAKIYFEKVKPVLKERCYACHGALKQKKDLRIDTAQQIIDAGIVKSGELIKRLTAADAEERMPQEGPPLHAEEIEAIQEWIAAGMPVPVDEKPEDDPASHWAFQRIERPVLPPHGKNDNAIDVLLAVKQAELGLQSQPQASRSLLIRRLYLDLIGLPPTREQAASTAPFESIVKELLASPHYGERWGRHWMDVWRYSDWYGLGKQVRNSQKHLWHWRDWIIDSINQDKGYDRMLTEMLAGDELEPDNPEVVAGTGFLARNYYLFNRTTWLDDTVEHTSKAFLGLTMNCVKCHDHKYDPLEQTDYYRFRAIFEPHQIRLDAVAGETDFEKDGLPRAFDDHPDAKTLLHIRGNPATPDEKIKITAGVPMILASFAPAAKKVNLPPYAWAPGSRDYVQQDQLAAARAKLDTAQKALEKSRQAVTAAANTKDGKGSKGNKNTAAKVSDADKEQGSILQDGFERMRPQLWDVVGRGWSYNGGILIQTMSSRDQQYVRSKNPHPVDFDLTLDFRTTGGATYKSVGIRFDVTGDGKNSHTVYASAHEKGPKVQISHTHNSKTSYPNARISYPVKVNEDYKLRVQVRGSLINVSLNGKFLLAYQLPNRNPNGNIELFAFDATAEFDSIIVKSLDQDLKLKKSGSAAKKAPDVDPAEQLKITAAKLKEAQLGLHLLKAKIAADKATLLSEGKTKKGGQALKAAQLEREHAVAQAEVAVLTAEAGKLKAAEKNLKTAQANLKKTDANYSSLRGSFKALETPEHKEPQYAATYSRSSTGRRLALAQWMTSRDNPLTARVAANHIWMRHFGEPLVESVFDFGLRAPLPEHIELLDYLAAELMDSGWSMKHLHHLIVTSKTWQRTSSNLNADVATLAKDGNNVFYWRMNARRMESEVIRDSMVHLAGELDKKMGGPSIKPSQNARRRSIYFLHDRDHKGPLLSRFDDADILACYRRSQSIVPQQALALSNSALSIRMSKGVYGLFYQQQDESAFSEQVFEHILCRKPDAEELAACVDFIAELQPESTQAESRIRLVHALFNHNDFINIR